MGGDSWHQRKDIQMWPAFKVAVTHAKRHESSKIVHAILKWHEGNWHVATVPVSSLHFGQRTTPSVAQHGRQPGLCRAPAVNQS